MNRRILVVDDDKNLRKSLACALEREGFETILASDGLTALDALEKSGLVDLAIVDIMMPRMDGIEFLKQLRSMGNELPFVFLTSRDEEFDRVLGLELGADDYLTKPFSVRELLARVKAILRRIEKALRDKAEVSSKVMRQGELAIDIDCYSARWGERELRLTLTEFRLLASMALVPGRVKTREQLLRDAYPEDTYLSDRTIDCHIKRLRKKLAEAQAPENAIETIYGLGYRYIAAGQR